MDEMKPMREMMQTIHALDARNRKDRLYYKALGMSGPSGTLGYYWLWEEVPPLWVPAVWICWFCR
jgi:hypothetical protein